MLRGYIIMNDKSVNLLDQYDMTVKSISKGRGTLICDTDIGKCIFKEYKGKPEKLELIKCLQDRFTDTLRTDNLIPTKENTLYVKDPIDNTTYILTSHIEGKECNHRSEDDLVKACSAMGRMHLRFMTPIDTTDLAVNLPINFYPEEMQRHTTECKRVYNYLKKRTAKTEFERKLLNEYNYFLDKAVSITKEAEEESKTEYEAYVRSNHLYCHGDYQYHNVLFGRTNDIPYTAIVNMEHLSPAPGINDFCLFFRKVCQKHDWSIDIAATMLDAYQNRRAIPPIELRSLRLMLEYPEKFWKIADHYYNSKKSWMPSNNLEKLNRLIKQEKNKEKLINKLF
jgi:CotS family spore coat protein